MYLDIGLGFFTDLRATSVTEAKKKHVLGQNYSYCVLAVLNLDVTTLNQFIFLGQKLQTSMIALSFYF